MVVRGFIPRPWLAFCGSFADNIETIMALAANRSRPNCACACSLHGIRCQKIIPRYQGVPGCTRVPGYCAKVGVIISRYYAKAIVIMLSFQRYCATAIVIISTKLSKRKRYHFHDARCKLNRHHFHSARCKRICCSHTALCSEWKRNVWITVFCQLAYQNDGKHASALRCYRFSHEQSEGS